MPFQLVIVQGRSATQFLKLGNGVTTVGRQPDCQLRIASSQVSRRHCQLFEKKGLLLVKDLGSSNGTFVNGKKVAEQRVLEPGDELMIGQVKFRVERIDETEVATNATVAPPKAGDTAIAEPVALGSDDVIPLEDDATTTYGKGPVPTAEPATAEPVTSPADADAEPEAAGAKKPEITEDAVAEYLLNIDVDDEDKF